MEAFMPRFFALLTLVAVMVIPHSSIGAEDQHDLEFKMFGISKHTVKNEITANPILNKLGHMEADAYNLPMPNSLKTEGAAFPSVQDVSAKLTEFDHYASTEAVPYYHIAIDVFNGEPESSIQYVSVYSSRQTNAVLLVEIHFAATVESEILEGLRDKYHVDPGAKVSERPSGLLFHDVLMGDFVVLLYFPENIDAHYKTVSEWYSHRSEEQRKEIDSILQ